MPILLIDGDVLLYRFSFANQFKVRWDEDTTSEVLYPFEKARDELDRFIGRLSRETRCGDVIVALSHALDFRFKVDPSYQAGRKGLTPPEYKERLLEYVQQEYPCAVMEWLEADDVLGIKATAKPGEFIVATIDKDLRQIPGKLYNWTKGKIENISLEDADFFFFTQLLTGDSTDGIKGIPGVGQKRAVAHLEGWHGVPPDQIWAHCLELYDEKGLSYDYALQQARLVRILRTGEYDINRRKPILWKGYPNVKPCNYGGHREEDHRGGAETH